MLAQILRRFRFSEDDVRENLDTLLNSLHNPAELHKLLSQMEQDTKNCYLCNNEGACLVLFAAIHFAIKDFSKSIRIIEDANLRFSVDNDVWNLIHSLELTGYIQDQNGNPHQARMYYKEAQRLLEERYKPTHSLDYDPAIQKVQEELKMLLLPKHSFGYKPFTLQIDALPIYESIEAGPTGPIWQTYPSPVYAELGTLLFDKKPYQIFSVLPNTLSLHFQPIKKYALVEVKGDSMNNATPTPICERDYVLFYEARAANHHDIVIVAKADSAKSGYQYLVKRFDETNKQLISETKSAKKYPPIPLTPEDYILGIVIAVAKPV